MNELQWFASTDPGALLRALTVGRGDVFPDPNFRVSERKLRLFACACCRVVWERLTDPRSRRAVEVAERYADGEATEAERQTAWLGAYDVLEPGALKASICCQTADRLVEGIGYFVVGSTNSGPPATQAALLRDLVGNPWRPVRLEDQWVDAEDTNGGTFRLPLPCPWITPLVMQLAQAAYDDTPARPCRRCRGKGWVNRRTPDDVGFGRATVTFDCPDCHGRGTAGAGLLAADRLAVLADAAEEAGCTDADLLMHLRGKGPCWNCHGKRKVPVQVLQDDEDPAAFVDVTCSACTDGWTDLPGPHARGCHALDVLLGRG